MNYNGVARYVAGMRWLAIVAGLASGLVMAQDGAPDAVGRDENTVFRAPWNGELLGTGARRPTAEQWTLSDKHMVKAKAVKLNKLGLERVNRAKKARGERELDAFEVPLAPLGSEVVGVTEDTRTLAATAGLPTSVDNSTLKYFPPIRSQGSLGSCAQFAAVYYTLTYMTAMARDWDAKNGGDQYRFSPKWTYNMVNNGNDGGSWYGDAYAIAQKHGLATWAELPYDSDYRSWCMNPEVWRHAIGMRADKYGKVTDLNTDTGLANLKQLLVNGYVLNVAIFFLSADGRLISDDPSTTADDAAVGQPSITLVNGIDGGHALTVVGFNDDVWTDANGDGVLTPDEKGALRYANSWGPEFNNGGFGWISYAALRTPNPALPSEGALWWDEAMWVTARPAYSPKLLAEFTVNHASRNQLQMTLGTSGTGSTAPTVIWTPNKLLSYSGGAFDFVGGTAGVDGTFCLDLTDLVPTTAGNTRYYLGMRDKTTGVFSTLKDFTLIDLVHNQALSCVAVPAVADASQAYVSLDYDMVNTPIVPVALATAAPLAGTAPLPVTFDARTSYDPDGSVAGYTWDFGDGSTGSGSGPQHTYGQSGTYTATLTVTDNAGLQDSTTLTVTVNAVSVPPVAVASATPTSGTVPLPVSFGAASSHDPDGSITAYAWNFGDGTSGSGVSVQHTYGQSGTYTVTLTVTDNTGLQNSTTLTVTANPAPVVTMVINAPTGLKASVRSPTVTLTWTDKSSNETGFQIERAVKSASGVGTYALAGTVGANVRKFIDTATSGTYCYRVRAVNSTAGAASAYSSAVTATVR